MSRLLLSRWISGRLPYGLAAVVLSAAVAFGPLANPVQAHGIVSAENEADDSGIPNELWDEIASFLPDVELARLAQTNRKFNQLTGVRVARTQKQLPAILADRRARLIVLLPGPNGLTVSEAPASHAPFIAYATTHADHGTVEAFAEVHLTALHHATVTVRSSAQVIASGDAKIKAFNSATVTASGHATVAAHGSVTVTASDHVQISAYDSAKVTASDQTTVRAYGQAEVSASDYVLVSANDSASVIARDNARVQAHGAGQIIASGNVWVYVTAWGYATGLTPGVRIWATKPERVTAADPADVKKLPKTLIGASWEQLENAWEQTT